MGITSTVNHTYLVTVVDKGDSNKRLSFITDFVLNVYCVANVLLQSGLTLVAYNNIGSLLITDSTGQGFLIYAELLA